MERQGKDDIHDCTIKLVLISILNFLFIFFFCCKQVYEIIVRSKVLGSDDRG